MAAIAEMSKAEIAQKLMATRQTLARQRREEKSMSQTVVGTAVGLAAGAAMGYHEGLNGSEYFYGVSTTAAVGIPATLAGLMGMGGEFAPVLLEVGRAGLYAEGYKRGVDMAHSAPERVAQPGG